MVTATQKSWKDFYDGKNRITAKVALYEERIKEKALPEAEIKKLHDGMKTSFTELCEYQRLQSFAFVSGLINQTEATYLYSALGGETPSEEEWDALTLAQKTAISSFMLELIKIKMNDLTSLRKLVTR
jgi:hypothetical protein